MEAYGFESRTEYTFGGVVYNQPMTARKDEQIAFVAQLVVQLICNQQVVGSSPIESSIHTCGAWWLGENPLMHRKVGLLRQTTVRINCLYCVY